MKTNFHTGLAVAQISGATRANASKSMARKTPKSLKLNEMLEIIKCCYELNPLIRSSMCEMNECIKYGK